jgi:hypothetical protein
LDFPEREFFSNAITRAPGVFLGKVQFSIVDRDRADAVGAKAAQIQMLSRNTRAFGSGAAPARRRQDLPISTNDSKKSTFDVGCIGM